MTADDKLPTIYYCIVSYCPGELFTNWPIPILQGKFHKSLRALDFSKHFKGKIFMNGDGIMKFLKNLPLKKTCYT